MWLCVGWCYCMPSRWSLRIWRRFVLQNHPPPPFMDQDMNRRRKKAGSKFSWSFAMENIVVSTYPNDSFTESRVMSMSNSPPFPPPSFPPTLPLLIWMWPGNWIECHYHTGYLSVISLSYLNIRYIYHWSPVISLQLSRSATLKTTF